MRHQNFRRAMLAATLALTAFAVAGAERSPAIQASKSGVPQAGTVTASSADLIAAATNPAGRIYVAVKNQSASVAIACRWGGTAAVNGAGSYDIPAEWEKVWSGPFVPSDALNCISASGSVNVTWTAY